MVGFPRFIQEEISHVALHERLLENDFGMDVGLIKVPQTFQACQELVFQAWGSLTLILISFIIFPLRLSHENYIWEYHDLS